MIAIKECILGRNPNLSLLQIEELLSQFLGVKNFIWLNRGLFLEENNGHIDNMCCFADHKTILLNWCDDDNDPQYDISQEAYGIIKSARNIDGETYNIVKISQPPALHITDAESSGIDSSEYAIPRVTNMRLPASYINSYICNDAVIIPSFSTNFDESPLDYDNAALKTYREIFKNRTVIQVQARELLLGGGGIHCILQQVPQKTSKP